MLLHRITLYETSDSLMESIEKFSTMDAYISRPSPEFPLISTGESDEGPSEPLHMMRLVSLHLQLPIECMEHAFTYYHRYIAQSPRFTFYVDGMLMAAACVHLACKTTESTVKIRDVVNGFYALLYPTRTPLNIDATYHKLRESIVHAELILLRWLKFDTTVEGVHAWVVWMLDSMQGQKGTEYSSVARGAWMNAHVCMYTSLMTRPPRIVACACVYAALLTTNHTLSIDLAEWCEIYGDTTDKHVLECVETLSLHYATGT
jgi:hypothetical protein